MNVHERHDMWQEACAVALAGLPGMGPARLSALLNDQSPDSAWQSLATEEPLSHAVQSAVGGAQTVVKRWYFLAKRLDPLEVLERYREHDIQVWSRYGTYPARLTGDEYGPAVAFYQGCADALLAPTVAIIGTRHCTNEGRSLARMFGEELSDAGVAVVSGLALGIDGAAHQGVLGSAFGAPPVAVVGSGLDVVYPKRNGDLWAGVRRNGLLISESPLGAAPEPWRFPARNRIIAGLADLVLVVESHDRGGSLLTVDQAVERGVPVMAVPGSVRSPASRGTNRLLTECAIPACSTQDVLDELRWQSTTMADGLAQCDQDVVKNSGSLVQACAADLPILEAVGYTSTSTDEILRQTCLPLGEVAVALTRLQAIGLVIGEAGWWCRTQSSEGAA